MVKLVVVLLVFLASALQAATSAQKEFCVQVGVQSAVTSYELFYKKAKPELDGVTNFLLESQGLKPMANALSGKFVSADFEKTYYELSRKVTETQITDNEIKQFQKKLAHAFIQVRPNYLKGCAKIMDKYFAPCKISLTAKELTPAQKICSTKFMNQLKPVLESSNPNFLADADGALQADNALSEAIRQHESSEAISKLLDKRLTFLSHFPTIIPLTLKRLVDANHVGYRKEIFVWVNKLKGSNEVKSMFKDKLTIMRASLKHQDLEYFKLLLGNGWLTPAEMKSFAAEVENPAAKKLLR